MSIDTVKMKEATSKTTVAVSAKEKLKGNINFAKVVVRDTSSGEVISTKRVVLLAKA